MYEIICWLSVICFIILILLLVAFISCYFIDKELFYSLYKKGENESTPSGPF